MNIDFAIHSTQVLLPSGLGDYFVMVGDGKIIDVTNNLPENPDFEIIEAGDLVVMPGLIDSHVHINEPGRTEWEGFDTMTKAAAAGGVTTLVDMPLNSSPVTTTVEAFNQKLEVAKDQLHVNCGFYGGIIPENVQELEPLIKAGVLGIKTFLVHSGIDEFPNVNENDLRKAMPTIAQTGIPLLVHSELIASPTLKEEGIKASYSSYLSSRPKQWENNAIELMIRLCEEYNCKTHIVHLSSAEALPMIQEAKEKGLPLTVETCPHYLYFNAEDIPDDNTLFKCAPPIREKENNDQLWDALKNGLIDFVVTDHSPATPDLKKMGTSDWENAWGGISSIQFSLSAFWTKAKEKGFKVEDVAKLMSSNVAKFLSLDDRKEKIEKGYDADLVIWDPEGKYQVKEDSIHFKNKITPFINEELCGIVMQTFVNGKKVYDNGEFVYLQVGELIIND